jgi:hypothetical protein
MPNNRIFYASHGVAVGVDGGSATTVQGAQSVGITTNFNLEQAFQLGQLAIYDNMITDPTVEVTVSKVLDGELTIYELATGGGSLVSTANTKSKVVVGVGSDTAEALTSTAAVTCTGIYISSLSYTFPVDGSFTEEVTFIGDNKSLSGSVSAPSDSGNMVARRQNLQVGSSTLPSEVASKNLSSITISTDLGRDAIYKLGQYAPYHRYVNFPIEITTEIAVTATTTDGVPLDITGIDCDPTGLPPEQAISISVCADSGNATHTFDLGSKNRLQSVNYTGGDTGGGNVEITYTYVTYNDLSISTT